MKNLLNYITGLIKYYDLLVKTEEAENLMKQEIKTKTYQRDRYWRLCNVCINVHDHLFKTFDEDLTTLGNDLSIDLLERNAEGHDLLYAQIFNRINRLLDKVVSKNKMEGFSTESIGEKFSRINEETPHGTLEEKDIECNFSIAMLANDLCKKINRLQVEINEQFEFLKQNHQLDNEKANTQKTPFILPAAPDGIFKPACQEKFYEVEKTFMGMASPVYLDFTGRWVGSVQSLAEFIWCLKDLNFFIGKRNSINRQEKDFFKNRYKLNKQLEQKTYPTDKPDFSKNQFKTFFP